MAKKDGEALSAFERRRLENMAVNKAILSDISATAQKLLPDTPLPKPRKSAPKKKARVETIKVEPRRSLRKSSRIAGLDAADDTLKRKLEVEAQHVAEEARLKKMRNNDDLHIGDIAVDGKKFGNGVAAVQELFRGARPGVRTFTEDDVKETTDKGLKELRLRMGGLKLYEQWAPNDIKITPQRIYSLSFHPGEEKPIIFAGDKEGAMGIFDASQTAPEIDDDDEDADIPDPVISAFKTHARTISSFAFSSTDMSAVYTASYDSSIRRMDLSKGISVQMFAPSDVHSDMPISGIEIPYSDPNTIYFSTLDGYVGRFDTRSPGDHEIWRLSEQKIGGFSLHPLQPHLIATASLDRTLRLWDVRKIAGKGELKRPALLGQHESRLSVSHASWSAGGHVATSSYDDTIKIHDFSNASSWKVGEEVPSGRMNPAHSVKHNNQTGRWVTILKPQWQKRPSDGIQKLAIGNMNRFVDVFASDGSQLAQLGGDGISAVPAVAQFHPTMDWVAGGTASGKLCLWQ